MKLHKKIALISTVILLVLCIVTQWSSILPRYYKVKYYTGVSSSGLPEKMVSRMSQANPFLNNRYAVLINLAQPSSFSRLRVYDLRRQQTRFATRVMHGKRSGKVWATRFSNRVGSNMSALGRYVIVGEYKGRFGKAYRLTGLDATNSNALARSIVLHSSDYVSVDRIGRSEGCPAVSKEALNAMKPYLGEGTLVWLYIRTMP